MVVAVKVGPWGASGGEHHDISRDSKPQSLVSITICSSKAFGGPILGISFVYVDQNEEQIPVGPWGMIDPEQRITNIEMVADEYPYELSGLYTQSALYSLRLVTNQHEYEVAPQHEGTAGSPEIPYTQSFSVPLVNGKVVAFFGRSDDTLKALGIYVAPVNGWPVKIGPWGGPGGTHVEITWVQVKSITVYSTQSSDGRINGISFAIVDENGQCKHVTWGKTKGQRHTFILNEGEYLNKVSGTFDDYSVTSLKVATNQNPEGYGPFGCERGTAFGVPLPDDRDDHGAVVGFHGRFGDSLFAFGVIVGVVHKAEP